MRICVCVCVCGKSINGWSCPGPPQKKPLILFEMSHQHEANGGELGRKPLVKCVEASVYIVAHISTKICDESRVFFFFLI
jgi:hypothetical protein